jgi:hypothetical protein
MASQEGIHLNMGHVTSAIPEMSVADIRKGLQRLRLAWEKRGPDTPLFLSDPLIRGMSMEEFAMRLILGQHLKRHAKSLLQRAAAVSNSEAARRTREEAAAVAAAAVAAPDVDDGGMDMEDSTGGEGDCGPCAGRGEGGAAGAPGDAFGDGLLTIRGEDGSYPGAERVTLYVLTRTR